LSIKALRGSPDCSALKNEFFFLRCTTTIAGLQLRLECLVQPLNTLLLWSIDKDSTTQPIVINAMQTVQNVCEFIANIEKERGEFTQENSDYLEFYLREMDF